MIIGAICRILGHMRIHVSLLDVDGTLLTEGSFESPSITIAGSAHGEAEVERCDACALAVVEPEDERRLTGRG